MSPDDVTIGFGCLWDRSREQTWSHTPLSLLHALQQTGPCVDLGHHARLRGQAFKMRYLRYRNGRLSSNWRYQSLPLNAAARAIQNRADSSKPDVIVTIPDVGVFSQPFLVYQDLSYDLVLREVRSGNQTARANFSALSLDDIERLAQRQRRVFDSAAGVLAMSQWHARSLVLDSGIDPERVTVVRPGATSVLDLPPLDLENRGSRLLFVGRRDFARKGGDLAVEAVRLLRRAGENLTLTVVGPRRRPDSLPFESWIDFRGELAPVAVADLMRSHVAFVLPTLFDAYGIVYHEALRAGTPCVGPDSFAIPEIISDGVNGALFTNWTGEDVAAAVVRAIAPDVRENALRSAPMQLEQLSWDRAAREVRAAAANALVS